MNVLIPLFFAVLVSAQAERSYLPGSWSAWTNVCTDVCGLCGTTVRIRRCLAGTCVGDVREDTKERCGPELCPFPRRTCCGSAKPGREGKHIVCVEPANA
uniref:VWFC domain-containing protein n=1 Tax=Steinernema glaseri TaxID=37863 RepID=A0A1I7ZEQ7_9BILA